MPGANRAAALEILALDSMEAFEILMRDEAKAMKEDLVRKAALVARQTSDWVDAVREFVAAHSREFQGGGGSQLHYTQRHEDFQEACEGHLEDLLTAADVDPTAALQKLCMPVAERPAGVTPLSRLSWQPLRAFVDYKSFEEMMTAGL